MILTMALIAIFISTVALVQVWRLASRLRRILGDSSSVRLEKQLREHHAKNKDIQANLKALALDHKTLASIANRSIQKTNLVRFNPFGDIGGDQSFSLAMLDGSDTGFIISSIHGRDGARIYAKPVVGGKSKYSLSAEEKQALMGAVKEK